MCARSRFQTRSRRFLRREDGTATVEFLLWVPIIFMLLVMILDVSYVYFQRATALRMIQDVNRAFSIGRLEDEAEATAAILAAIHTISPNGEAATVYDTATGIITTYVNMPASDLMPVGTVPGLGNNFTIGLSAQHYAEI